MKDCNWAREHFSLLLYGELSFDQEERVESHLDACADCRGALQRERALHASFDAIEITPSPSLLRECRQDLFARLADEPAPAPVRSSWWDRLVDSVTVRPSSNVLRPAGALTLIALGYFAAQVVPAMNFKGNAAGLIPGAARVRYIEPASDGKIHIVLDETRQRIVSGKFDDQQIKALLLTAAKDPSDPGLRAETVDLLNTRAESADVRDALIKAVKEDQNAGVRMKAMEGLKPFMQDPAVRSALTHVLLTDSNPGMRTQAIDLLTKQPSADRQLISTLQELMQRGEPQSYVRDRCRRALEAMNASLETY